MSSSSSSAQVKAQQLNAKLEQAARNVIDVIDQKYVRKIARSAYACVVSCYDKAGSSGSSETLDHCARSCHAPHQQANHVVQNVRTTKERDREGDRRRRRNNQNKRYTKRKSQRRRGWKQTFHSVSLCVCCLCVPNDTHTNMRGFGLSQEESTTADR